jgi:hypothetical protein
MAKTKLALYDNDQISFFKADQLAVSALAYIRNTAGDLVMQAESTGKLNFKSSLLLDTGLTIGSAGSSSTLTIGNSGDIINLNASGVTYNIGTLTGSPTFTGNITTQGSGTNTFSGTTNFTGTVNFNGTTVELNVVNLTIDDKNIELGSVATPTDITADGGGITLRGTTNKSLLWDDANDNWTSSEHWNIAAGKFYKIGNTNLLGFTDPYTISYQNLKITNTSLTNTTRFVVEGNNGQLFAIVDDLSDSLLSVNDISGLPILEVFATDKVVMGKFGLNTLVVNSDKVGIGIATPSVSLEVNGTIAATLFSGKPGVQSDVRIRGNSAAGDVVLNNGDGRHVFIYNGASTVTAAFTSDGKVGIGTSAPGEKLTIIATANVTTDILKIRDNSLTEKFVVSLDSAGIPYISFNSYGYLRTTANANQLFLASSGNIGIGTATTGTDKLRVEGDGPVVRINATTNGGNLAQLKLSWDGSDTHGLAIGYSAVSAESFIDAVYPKYTGTVYGDIRFRRNVASVMTDTLIIKGDTGNVGIGTTAPQEKLHILGDPTDTNQPWGITNTANDLHTGLFINGSGNAVNEKFGIQFGNYNQYGFAGIYSIMTSTSGTTVGDLTFDLRTLTTDQRLTEIMRITSAGNVGIGTTNPGSKLHIEDTTNGVTFTLKGSSSNYLTQTSQSNGVSLISTTGGSLQVFTGGTGDLYLGSGGTASRIFISGTSGYAGIAATTPLSLLQVGPTGASDVANVVSRLTVIGGTVQSETTETLLRLERVVSNNVYYPATVDFKINAYQAGGVGTNYNPATKLTIALKNSQSYNLAADIDVLTLQANGYVGIGTISPTSTLYLNSAAASTQLSIDNTATDGDPIIKFLIGGQGTFTLGIDDSDGDKFKIATTGIDTNVRLTIDSAGNVGIGNTVPGYKLDVTGDANISGHLYASVKHFRAEDPTNPNHYITYSSLEGPENAVFYRGRIDTNANTHVINLPKEWSWLVDENSISVFLTAEESFQNLSYVIEQDSITIKNTRFFSNKIKCSYLIMATRKDIKPLEVYS